MFVLLLPVVVEAQVVELIGEAFAEDSGQALFMIYRAKDDLPSSPFNKVTASIKDGKATARIELPIGEYAVILLHDKNRNGTVDHWLGFPSEPLGYSANWKLSWRSGMPSFRKLKFDFISDGQQVHIPITYKK